MLDANREISAPSGRRRRRSASHRIAFSCAFRRPPWPSPYWPVLQHSPRI